VTMNLSGVTDADNCNERDAEANFPSSGAAGIPPPTDDPPIRTTRTSLLAPRVTFTSPKPRVCQL